jgi:hypothetical protein
MTIGVGSKSIKIVSCESDPSADRTTARLLVPIDDDPGVTLLVTMDYESCGTYLEQLMKRDGSDRECEIVSLEERYEYDIRRDTAGENEVINQKISYFLLLALPSVRPGIHPLIKVEVSQGNYEDIVEPFVMNALR